MELVLIKMALGLVTYRIFEKTYQSTATMDDETNKLSHKTLVLIAVLPNPKIFLSRIKSLLFNCLPFGFGHVNSVISYPVMNFKSLQEFNDLFVNDLLH